MPKKPKHIKDKVDQYIRENYLTKEIIEKIEAEGEKVSASYISTRRKIIRENDEKKRRKVSILDLSDNSKNLLYDLQNRLGKKDLDTTIKTISEDYRAILQEKYKYDFDNEKTVAQVFNDFKESHRIINTLDKNESQLKVYEKMKLKKDPFGCYHILCEDVTGGYKINFFDFLSEKAIKYITEVERSVSTLKGNPFTPLGEEEFKNSWKKN